MLDLQKSKPIPQQRNRWVSFFDISTEKDHGDYATSCALKLSKQFKLSPRELADQIVQELNNTSIEKISIEGRVH